jgi:hypothetical protein
MGLVQVGHEAGSLSFEQLLIEITRSRNKRSFFTPAALPLQDYQ